MEKVYVLNERTRIEKMYESNSYFKTMGVFTSKEQAEKEMESLEIENNKELSSLYEDDYEYGDDESKDFRIDVLDGTDYSIQEIIINQLIK